MISCVELFEEMEEGIQNCDELTNNIQISLRSLELNIETALADDQLRRTQYQNLSRTFLNFLLRYQTVQLDIERMQRDRLERQFRIVNPQATEEEIEQIRKQGNPVLVSASLFKKSLSMQKQGVEASLLAEELQNRHESLDALLASIETLQKLFKELQSLLKQQDPLLDQIVNNIDRTGRLVSSTRNQMTLAVNNRQRRRKIIKKMSLVAFGIVFLILLYVILQVAGAINNTYR